jgi:hypothetical protein
MRKRGMKKPFRVNLWGKGKVGLVVFGCLWIFSFSIAQEVLDDISSEKQQTITRAVKVENYIIKPEDKLTLQILEKRQDPVVPVITPVILHVSPSGEVDVPMLGRTGVAGKTLSHAAKDIKMLVERQLFYEVTVKLSVEETRIHSVAISPKTKQNIIEVLGKGPKSSDDDSILNQSPVYWWGGTPDVQMEGAESPIAKYFMLIEKANKDPTTENFLKAWDAIKSINEEQNSLANNSMKPSKIFLVLTLQSHIRAEINRHDQQSTKTSAAVNYQRELMALDEEISNYHKAHYWLPFERKIKW